MMFMTVCSQAKRERRMKMRQGWRPQVTYHPNSSSRCQNNLLHQLVGLALQCPYGQHLQATTRRPPESDTEGKARLHIIIITTTITTTIIHRHHHEHQTAGDKAAMKHIHHHAHHHHRNLQEINTRNGRVVRPVLLIKTASSSIVRHSGESERLQSEYDSEHMGQKDPILLAKQQFWGRGARCIFQKFKSLDKICLPSDFPVPRPPTPLHPSRARQKPSVYKDDIRQTDNTEENMRRQFHRPNTSVYVPERMSQDVHTYNYVRLLYKVETLILINRRGV